MAARQAAQGARVDEIRRRRLEEQLRDVIAALILGGQVKDPRVGPFISITRVEAARDLSVAKVFVSAFPAGGDSPTAEGGDPSSRKGADSLDLAVAGLANAAGFIQSQVAKRMKTRLTPHLTFIADKGIKEGFELNERMKGLFS
jgi:ribosome-binding factor A